MVTCKTADCVAKGVEHTAPENDLYCGICGMVMSNE